MHVYIYIYVVYVYDYLLSPLPPGLPFSLQDVQNPRILETGGVSTYARSVLLLQRRVYKLSDFFL